MNWSRKNEFYSNFPCKYHIRGQGQCSSNQFDDFICCILIKTSNQWNSIISSLLTKKFGLYLSKFEVNLRCHQKLAQMQTTLLVLPIMDNQKINCLEIIHLDRLMCCSLSDMAFCPFHFVMDFFCVFFPCQCFGDGGPGATDAKFCRFNFDPCFWVGFFWLCCFSCHLQIVKLVCSSSSSVQTWLPLPLVDGNWSSLS